MYSVNLYDENPYFADPTYGEDFATEKEARKAFENAKEHFNYMYSGTRFVELFVQEDEDSFEEVKEVFDAGYLVEDDQLLSTQYAW